MTGIDGKETGTRTFVITSTTRLTGFESVIDLPARGDAWPGRSTLWASTINADEVEQLTGGWAWTVTVEYVNYTDDGTSTDHRADLILPPLLRRAKWSWHSEVFTETRFKDLDGKPYVNTVGDPFDPPPVFDVAHPIATVVKNMASCDGGFVLAYTDKVNHAAYLGAARGQVKIDSIVGAPASQNEVEYYEVTFILHYNPSGWNPYKEMNRGPRYFETIDGTSTLVFAHEMDFATEQQVSCTEPVLINEDGTRAIENPSIWGSDFSDAPFYCEFRQYDYANFSALGLV
jgi:hypothetical protein